MENLHRFSRVSGLPKKCTKIYHTFLKILEEFPVEKGYIQNSFFYFYRLFEKFAKISMNTKNPPKFIIILENSWKNLLGIKDDLVIYQMQEFFSSWFYANRALFQFLIWWRLTAPFISKSHLLSVSQKTPLMSGAPSIQNNLVWN